jgi:predicted anti-sigma-YlaC factor YlaD
MRHVRPKSCDRARFWLSLQLDDELSGFERHLLGAHLRRCEDCRAYEVGLGLAAAVVRSEPLEPLERPVLLPPAHSRFRVVRLTASAAAAAFVAVAVTGVLAVTGSNQHPRLLPGANASQTEVRELRQLRRDEVIVGPVNRFSHVQPARLAQQ